MDIIKPQPSINYKSKKYQRNEKIINDRIKSDYNFLQNQGYNVLGVFLYGSQNYNLDYFDSDIDTKAIVIPSLEDIVLNVSPVSKTIKLDTDEQIDVKDIRVMFEIFRKQNVNFLEILFTKYNYINPLYKDLFKLMFENREIIARYNNYKFVKCVVGMMCEKRAAMCHPYPKLVEKIKKYGYDGKQLHHIIRCKELLERYISGEPFSSCLISENTQYLIDVKANKIYNKTEAVSLADKFVEEARKLEKNYFENNPPVINNRAELLMRDVMCNIVRKSINM